jgi:hypothetical protein
VNLAVDLAEFGWIGQAKRSVTQRRTQEFKERLFHFQGVLKEIEPTA